MIPGFLHCLSPSLDIELGKDVGQMCLDGIQGYKKFIGDFLIAVSIGNKGEYFHFSLAEAKTFASRCIGSGARFFLIEVEESNP